MRPKFWVKGDLDGLVGLFVDNLLQLLLIAVLCPLVCGLPIELVTTRILPGAALSILFGNLFYSWQAWRLARRTGRTDVTALPYGINTVSLIAFIFLIMAPIWQQTRNPELVWQAGGFACFISAAFELAGAWLIDPLRRFMPRAALLSSLAGVAITFIAMGFAFQIFASPAIAVVPMFLIVVAYAARIKLPFGLPAGFVAILLGVIAAWILRAVGIPAFQPDASPVTIGFFPPVPDVSGLFHFLANENGWQYLAVIFPMALFNVMGSLQTLESAEAAGDRYPTVSSLTVNGLGSLAAAVFGSAFPTTLYIGHPGWKAMGARIGYSAVNGVLICLLCFLGAVTLVLRFIPLECTLGILIWIGIVIAAQAFQETPKAHALAVAFGLIPSLAAWAYFLIDTSLGAAGSSLFKAAPAFGNTLYLSGVLALNQGFLLSSLLFAAIVAFVLDHRLIAAAGCAAACALLAAGGLLHGYELTAAGLQPKFGWMVSPGFAFSYLALAGILLGLRWLPGRSAAGRSTAAPEA